MPIELFQKSAQNDLTYVSRFQKMPLIIRFIIRIFFVAAWSSFKMHSSENALKSTCVHMASTMDCTGITLDSRSGEDIFA